MSKVSNIAQKTNDLLPITNLNEKLVVDSRIIADALGIQHKNLMETIKKYQNDIEKSFQRVAFKTETTKTNGGNQDLKFAYLTEDQATFIATLSRNTAQVVAFKIKLVKSFFLAKKLLNEIASPDKVSYKQLEKDVEFWNKLALSYKESFEATWKRLWEKDSFLTQLHEENTHMTNELHDAKYGKTFLKGKS